MNNGFICKDLYAPFVLEKDSDYLDDLKKKYKIVIRQAESAGADDKSLKILKKFKNKVLEALKCYYKADIEKCNTIIRNLIKDVGEDSFATNTLDKSYAFPGGAGTEIQFFRCRMGNPSNAYVAKDMLHLPQKLRARSGNYRFSIPGNPSLYLANSSYGCWIETGFPAENEFNVSPVLMDGTQKILNLAVSIRDFHALNDFEEGRVYCWLKLYMLTIVSKWRSAEQQAVQIEEFLGNKAVDVSKKNIGYYIESTTPTGEKRYIEVKSLQKDSSTFAITNNEYTSAHQLGDAYYICLIFDNKAIYIQNPLKNLSFEKRIRQWEWRRC